MSSRTPNNPRRDKSRPRQARTRIERDRRSSSRRSYKLVFDFLLDVIGPERMFIYLDEYFIDAQPSVHVLYESFCAEAKRRHNLDSLYMRNAAGCGALFSLMPTRD